MFQIISLKILVVLVPLFAQLFGECRAAYIEPVAGSSIVKPFGTTVATTTLDDELELMRSAGGFEMDSVEEFPYIASIYEKSSEGAIVQVLCTGILVNTTHILTSARCARTLSDLQKMEIRLGSAKCDHGGVTRKVVNVTVHPDYKIESTGFDTSMFNLALLEMDKPVEETGGIKVANFVSTNEREGFNTEDLVNKNTICKTAGYGMTSLHHKDAGRLRTVNATLFPWAECNLIYMGAVEKMAQVCATTLIIGGNEESKTCFYDDGAALWCNGKVHGIYVFSGRSVDCVEFPDLFVRLDFLSNFLPKPPSKQIDEKVKNVTNTRQYVNESIIISTKVMEIETTVENLQSEINVSDISQNEVIYTFPTFTETPVTLPIIRSELEEETDKEKLPEISVTYPICQALRMATANNPCPAPCGIPPNPFEEESSSIFQHR